MHRPDFPGKLKALRARGGTLTVIDPRTTRTAKLADRHVTVRPGTDALLLAAMTYVLFEEKLVDLRELAPNVQDVEELATAVRDFTPRPRARPATWTPTPSARSPANSPPPPPPPSTAASAAAPSRTAPSPAGSSTSSTSSPATSTAPAAPSSRRPPPTRPRPAGPGRGFALGRWHSRVSRHPEAKGELPLAALAEEIDTATPEGSPVRALIAIAANPVLSAPDGDRLDKALDSSTSWSASTRT